MMDREGFEGWLMFVDDTIGQLLAELPVEVASHLTFLPESLDILEGWLLRTYPSASSILQPQENWLLDRLAKYVGETIRRNAGGKWEINLDKPDGVFYGLPVVTRPSGYSDCPAALVTTSLDRRRGTFLRTIVSNIVQENQDG